MTLRTVKNDRLADGAKLDNLPADTNAALNAKVSSIQAGSGITVDETDPQNPIVSSTGGGGSGTVTEVTSSNADIAVTNGTTTPELTLNSGTGANQIVKLDGSAKLPAVDGSQLTNLPTQSIGYYTYMFSGTNSDISGYESMPSLTQYTIGALATASATVTTTPTLLASFATNIGYPNVTVIPAGTFTCHFETQKASGGHSYYSYYEIYKRTSGGAETLIATSDTSTQTSDNTNISTTLTASISSSVSLSLTDRVVVKVYAVMVSNSATIELHYDDSTEARFEMVSSLVDATNFVPYANATADVNLGSKKLLASNVNGFTTTVTAAGTTTLTSSSTFNQVFTGTTTQTVVLPVPSTLTNGTTFYIENDSSGLVTVQADTGSVLTILPQFTSVYVTCKDTTATTGTNGWNWFYSGAKVASGKKLTALKTITLDGTDSTTMTFPTTSATIARTDAAQTFTGVQTFSSSPVVPAPTSGTDAVNKTYADGLVTGLLDYRGGYNASGNTYPTTGGSGTAGAILKGDMFVISVAGTLGGSAVEIGDAIIANVDTPGQTAANWNILNTNIAYVPENVANKATTMSGNTASNTLYLSAKAVYDWGVATFASLAGSISQVFSASSIELGHATDTTLSRSSAGVLAVEGVVIPSISSTNDLTNKSFKPVTLDSNYSATFKNLAGTTVAGVRGDGDAVNPNDLMTYTKTGSYTYNALTSGTYTFNNKTLEIGGTAGNVVFGTAAEWNLCVTDDQFVFGGGTCTGTMSGTSSGTNTGDHEDGWQPAGETWTYASATTFTISGDKTTKYQRGDRIKLTQSSTVKYFVVLKVAFSASTTTVTITGGTDYTLANSAISSNNYSKVVSPQGYPDWFNFTPVYTGFSSAPTVDFAQCRFTGNTCDVRVSCSANGTSNSTSFGLNTPSSVTSVGQAQGSVGFPVDNGTALGAAYASLSDTSSSITFRKTMDTSTSWTASGGKRAHVTISFRYTL